MKNNSNIPIEYRAFLESKNDFSKANAELKRYQHLNNPNYKPIIGNKFVIKSNKISSCFKVQIISLVLTALMFFLYRDQLLVEVK